MQHSFNIEIAKEYGLLEAIIINNLFFWIEKNKANNVNYYDGTYWTYNSIKALNELFPYASERKISYALKHLEEEGIIKTGNYNKLAQDRTLWYAFTEKGISILQNCCFHFTKSTNGFYKSDEPIPDINTDINTDIIYNPPTTCEDYMYADAYPQADQPKKARPKINYQEIADMYNTICISLPRMTTLSDKRKEAIAARLKHYTVDQFREMFTKAENSAFLKGSNNRNWMANFDWLIKDANFAKVLDGNYDNTIGTTTTGNQTSKTTTSKTTTSKTTQEFETNSFDIDELYNMALQKSYKELGLS